MSNSVKERSPQVAGPQHSWFFYRHDVCFWACRRRRMLSRPRRRSADEHQAGARRRACRRPGGGFRRRHERKGRGERTGGCRERPDERRGRRQHRRGGRRRAASGRHGLSSPAARSRWASTERGRRTSTPRTRSRSPRFFLDRTEVTNEAYASCVKASGCQREGHPRRQQGARRTGRGVRPPEAAGQRRELERRDDVLRLARRRPAPARGGVRARRPRRRWTDVPVGERASRRRQGGLRPAVRARHHRRRRLAPARHAAPTATTISPATCGSGRRTSTTRSPTAAPAPAPAPRGRARRSCSTLNHLRASGEQGFTGSNPIPNVCEHVLRGGAFNYDGFGLRSLEPRPPPRRLPPDDERLPLREGRR